MPPKPNETPKVEITPIQFINILRNLLSIFFIPQEGFIGRYSDDAFSIALGYDTSSNERMANEVYSINNSIGLLFQKLEKYIAGDNTISDYEDIEIELSKRGITIEALKDLHWQLRKMVLQRDNLRK